jgi:hypothetical protein
LARSRKEIGFLQQTAPAVHYVLALRGELKAAANAVEQQHAKLGFQRLDLARGRGLAQMQPPSGAGETAGVGDGDQGLQSKVHPGLPAVMQKSHE